MGSDAATRVIVDFAAATRDLPVSEPVTKAVVRNHFDSIGCAIGGLDAEPSRIARRWAMSALSDPGCSVFGVAQTVAAEQAVFANTTMVRQLDFNDYGAPGGGHPSDMIPAVVAAAEIAHASGADLVRGIYIAYEVAATIVSSYPVERAGWDHGSTATTVGAAMGAGAILALTTEQLASAVGIAVAPSMALGVTRKGSLSNWKGSASSLQSMNGLLAARLAQFGLTGPEAPFEGVNGMNRQVQPEKPVSFDREPGAPSAVERSNIKLYPAVVNAQYLIGPLLTARKKLRVDDVKQVSIETFAFMYNNLGGGVGDHATKWHPATRETSDHSLPYIVAVCLLDGDITENSFSEERMQRSDVRSMMPRIMVSERAAFTLEYPAQRLSTIAIELSDGSKVELSSETPLGNYLNPATDEQLIEKFRKMSLLVMSEEKSLALESILWGLPTLDELGELTRFYRELRPS